MRTGASIDSSIIIKESSLFSWDKEPIWLADQTQETKTQSDWLINICLWGRTNKIHNADNTAAKEEKSDAHLASCPPHRYVFHLIYYILSIEFWLQGFTASQWATTSLTWGHFLSIYSYIHNCLTENLMLDMCNCVLQDFDRMVANSIPWSGTLMELTAQLISMEQPLKTEWGCFAGLGKQQGQC